MIEDFSLENNKIYLFGPFRLEAAERLLFKGDAPIRLPGKVLDLLLILIQSAGHLRSREELIECLWPDAIVEEANLTWNVNALRRALGDDPSDPLYVETVRGHGYRFIAPVAIKTQGADSLEEAGERQGTPIRPARPLLPAKGLAALGTAAAILIVAALVWYFSWQESAQNAAPPTVAVLPFENLSADRSNAYFAAGIQDTILSKLAGIGELRVISRTSTRRYPSHPPDLKRVAAQLGATAVLEGSVQKAGKRVLINVQLIDVESNDHIWAHVYTRSLADVFAVENDVATRVATALRAKLLPMEAARLASAPTRNPQAYLSYLKAEYYANQVTTSKDAADPVAAATQAVKLYHQAIARDPDFALAWARLSYLESYAYWYEIIHTSASLKDAKLAARKALALRPTLPQAHLAMGYIEYYGHHNLAAALAQFKQARGSLPNNANIIGAIAYVHRRQGRWNKALAELRQAAILDPRNPRWPYDTGFTLMTLRRYDQAAQQFDQALALEPNDYDAKAFKAMTFLLAGKSFQDAGRVLAGIPSDSDPRGSIAAVRFELTWLARQPQAALAALHDVPEWIVAPDAVGLVPTSLLRAKAQALKGDTEQAQHSYEIACNLLQTALKKHSDDSNLWSSLALAEAGLGRDASAIRAGLKAVTLTPTSSDALSGASHRVTLAKVYALTDEPKQALMLLRQLLAKPAGGFISVPLLRHDPTWNSIRREPGFKALLEE